MKLKSLIIILASAFIGFLGCGDEEKISPSPKSMTPNKSWNTARTDVEIAGEGFMVQIKENLDRDDKAEIITGITAFLGSYPLEEITFHSSQKLTAIVPVGLPPGIYDLIITNPDGEKGILPEAFEVTNISSVEPAIGCLGEPVTISGSYFGADAGTVSFDETEAAVISWADTAIVVSAPGGDYTKITIIPAAGHISSIPGSYSYDYQAPTGLAASPAGGRYCPTTISLSVSEGTIYYTFDGNGPTTASQVYTGPIDAKSGTLMFVAVDVCGNRTSIISEFYNIDNLPPTGLAATPAGGSYCATKVSLSAIDYEKIYFTTDHTYPTTASPAYTDPIGLSVDTTIKFMAVDACGNQTNVRMENYYINSEALVTITSPEDGTTVIIAGDVTSGSVEVTGVADTDIAMVTVTTDQGHNLESGVDDSGNWSVILNEVSISSLVITARGTDNCGNTGSHSIKVTLYVPTIWYVNVTATGEKTGKSWDNAFTDIQSAANAASSGNMIWVAQGTYTNSPSLTTSVLAMKAGVEVYGGFIGTEALLSERGDPAAHQTILDGGGKSYHVVIGASNARLDGFIVKGGNAAGTNPDNCGGGMLNSGVTELVADNCQFISNLAVLDGGGIYNDKSSLDITNCTFSGNSADYGGGIYNSSSSPIVINCIFSSNSAGQGGGMHNSNSSPEIIGCTFSGNEAGYGGGIYTGTNSLTTIKNSILWDNWAEVKPEICNDGASTAIVSYSDVEGGWPGTNNIGDLPEHNPLFVTGPKGVYYLSQKGAGQITDSPCIDKGSDYAASLEMDDKTTRTDGVSDTGVVDMGYHYEPIAIGK